MAKFFTVLTQTGQAKMANAIALGTMIEITQLAVGDGGGSLPQPDSSRETLINEVRRAPINRVEVDADNPNWLVVEQILPPDVGGWTIREVGIIDADGDLIGYGNYPETYKPTLDEGSGRTQTIRMVLEVSHTAAVTLKVDPSVVLATRKYVDDADRAHAESRNHPAATTDELGFVEKATLDEGKAGTANKFPDSEVALSVLRHLGLGVSEAGQQRIMPSDLNQATESGWYVGTVSTRANKPDTATGESTLQVEVYDETRVAQTLLTLSNKRLYMRTMFNGVWKAWEEIYHSGNAIADQDTVDNGVSDSKFVTPKKLKAWATDWVKQSTETVAGMLKIATQAQVDAGTDDSTAVTPKKMLFGFDYQFGTNGYIALPSWLGGVIIQWVSVSIQTTTKSGSSGSSSIVIVDDNQSFQYVIPFPRKCYYVGGNWEDNAETVIESMTVNFSETAAYLRLTGICNRSSGVQFTSNGTIFAVGR